MSKNQVEFVLMRIILKTFNFRDKFYFKFKFAQRLCINKNQVELFY